MDEALHEWRLFGKTWKNRIPKRQDRFFKDFDNFINDLLVDDLSKLEAIMILPKYGTANVSNDKKMLYLYKSPFTIYTAGVKREIPINALFSPILDALVNGITKKYPKIKIIN